MCGIFGFFSRGRTISRAAVLSSLQALHHRGPDNAGVTFFEGTTRGCYPADSMPDGEWSSVFAHTRLSVIDLSHVAHQPMSNEDGSVWITYNGETYNFKEIRKELIHRGHIFKSSTDSEVVVHGYEEWETDVVHHLRGMFAFALLDRINNKILLARDRLGVKPLKYYYDGESFIFASELKGLMHLIPRKIDLNSLNIFLTLKYIPSPNTILEGVHKLAPGQFLEFGIHDSHVKTEFFWRPQFYPKNNYPFSEAKEQFKNLLSESVTMRTVSDVPIGVYLSGGMDSSAIVAFLKKGGINDINTFTMAFNRPGYDESEYARTVAQHFRTRHHEFQIPDLTFGELLNITGSLDEPFGDPSYIPSYFLSRFTAEYVKVILSGDGGDEILGGYKRYSIYGRSKVLGLLPCIDVRAIRKLPPEINKKSFMGKLQRFIEELSMGYWGAYLLRFNGLSDSFKRYVMVPELYNSLARFSIDDLIDNFTESDNIKNTIERLIWIDFHTYLPDYILTKTDLALMAHSVEGRNPLVDYRLVEFANSLKPHYKFREGGKYILKKILEDYLPTDIIYRKKMGFNPPVKYWFRDNISLLHEIFSQSEFVSTDFFDLKRINEVINAFKKSEVNISEQLWLIMVLELWRRINRV